MSDLLQRPRVQPAPAPPRPGLVQALARIALVPVRALGRLERALRARRTRRTPNTRPPRGLRRVLRFLLIPVVALSLFVGLTLGPALAAPGTDTTAARVAEWAASQTA